MWTVAGSGKVKRVLNRPDDLIGPCDLRGHPTGDQRPATAEIGDQATVARYRALIAPRSACPAGSPCSAAGCAGA
ncbi:hypothetical protein SFUMM280S_10792 [Streptomyces fumanus]